MEKGHYVVVEKSRDAHGGPKGTFLMKVESIRKGILTGVIEKDCHLPDLRSTKEVPVENVVLDLGDDPRPGKIHGVDVTARYRGRKTHDVFGTLYYFYNPKKDASQQLFKAFDKMAKTLKHNKLDFLIDPSTCIWEIMPYHGEKYAGMYIKPRSDKAPHRFRIRPEIMPSVDYPYVIAHEIGHYMHLNFATGKDINARWLQIYKSTINVKAIKREVCMGLLERLLEQEDLPSDFKGQLDEEDASAFKWILKWIKQQHNLSVQELDVLFEAGYKDDIKDVWPQRVASKDLAPLITEYATKNHKELIAESFAFLLTGKKLPKDVHKLMEKTIAYARANRERSSE